SDNNGFDWQFINWYFHTFVGTNPFGHSSTNLGSLYKGLVKDTSKNFKHLRRSKHTHDPVDDARGNAEALLRLQGELGLKIALRSPRGRDQAVGPSRSMTSASPSTCAGGLPSARSAGPWTT